MTSAGRQQRGAGCGGRAQRCVVVAPDSDILLYIASAEVVACCAAWNGGGVVVCYS